MITCYSHPLLLPFRIQSMLVAFIVDVASSEMSCRDLENFEVYEQRLCIKSHMSDLLEFKVYNRMFERHFRVSNFLSYH